MTTAAGLKRTLLGPPLRTVELEHERLNNATALAVFASDNLSSVAYATEEILKQLLPFVGAAAFSLVLPVTGAILVVLALLILSYRQTIRAYPSAGGAYVVTKDNLGILPAQVAGVALLTDYVLTVAVSTAAGVAAIYSSVPALEPFRVELSAAFVVVIAFVNLRGVKESGRIFAVPTYGFIAAMAGLLGVGVYRVVFGGLKHAVEYCAPGVEAALAKDPCVPHVAHRPSGLLYGAGVFLVLRAFSNGGSAVTGVEAISNGVPAFRKPEWRNARNTLVVMGSTLGTMFLGLSFLATRLHPAFNEKETVISQLGREVFGGRNAAYVYLQVMTAAILVLAANTSFADFPRLASFAAEDGFMPRPFVRRGHRLVFSNGILTLAGFAIAVVVVFEANVSRMIPLYALGVFVSFTLSQAGMTVKHLRERRKGWRSGVLINGAGAVTTAVVDVVIAVTKFAQGAWMVMIAVPIGVAFLIHLNKTYERERSGLAVGIDDLNRPAEPRHHVVVLVERLDASVAEALRYAKQISPFGLHSTVTALHAASDPVAARHLEDEWEQYRVPVPLTLVDCPDRDVAGAVVRWLDAHSPDRTEVTVIVAQRAYARFWHRLVHDRTSTSLARALRRLRDVQVVIVPHHVRQEG
ncbi:MAG TPA: APC family permease [Mycobacteriales bacterium]|jgi:amino acid transporter|nr:APC family permease [Mycobacteriales bacterium]